MSFIQLDLDALPKAYAMADCAGIGHAQAIGGLARCWEWCWRRKSINVDQALIGAFFQAQDRTVALVSAMLAVGFLDRGVDGGLSIRDDADRLGIRKAANRAKGAAAARLRKAPKQPHAPQKADDQASINVDRPLIDPVFEPNQASINVDRAHQEPESHKAIKDYVVCTDYDPSLYPEAAEKKPISQRTQGLAAADITPAQPVVNAPRGDHAAREAKPHRDDMTAAADFARRAFKTFSINAPRPPAAPPSSEQPPPASTAPPPPSPAISQPRPPETKLPKPADATTEKGGRRDFGP